ncbi:MAG TPA: helix-turn-helix domain-containing protein [Candidatus Peribacteraceae bacterium]|nr:helix-turn-helix domain-containing protein [Candidatus Peribacteraceae bacterium]
MVTSETFSADFESDHTERPERLPFPSDDEIGAAAQMADTLGDETRMGILRILYQDGKTSVTDLQKRITSDMTQGGFSHQLRVLRDRKMVEYGREGSRNMYYLTETGRIVMQRVQNLISSMQQES